MGSGPSTDCDVFSCCGRVQAIDTAAGARSESPQVPYEFQAADTANVSAVEEERGDSSFGSLFLFQRAQDSMRISGSLRRLPEEVEESRASSHHLSDLLDLVRKQQEDLESVTATEQSKLQEEREELEKEKKAISALLAADRRPKQCTESQPSFVLSSFDSKQGRSPRSERKKGKGGATDRSPPRLNQGSQRASRFLSSPHVAKP